MSSNFYNENIVKGKRFLVFAVIVAAILRSYHFIKTDMTLPQSEELGYLFRPLTFLLQEPLYNLIASSIFVGLIAFLINLINSQHVLIRRKTLLPAGIIILLFSLSPQQLVMTPSYIGVVTSLLSINYLFSAHNQDQSQITVFKTSFCLAIGSLFDPFVLIYLPILWISLIRIRSFSFKVFLSSLFSIILLYVPTFTYYFLIERDIDSFTAPFVHLFSTNWTQIPILEYNLENYILLGITVILLIVILLDNSVNGFKNKIRVRVLLAVLSIIAIASVIYIPLLNTQSNLPLYMAMATGSLLIAHLFSLNNSRLTPYMFYILLIFIIVWGIKQNVHV